VDSFDPGQALETFGQRGGTTDHDAIEEGVKGELGVGAVAFEDAAHNGLLTLDGNAASLKGGKTVCAAAARMGRIRVCCCDGGWIAVQFDDVAAGLLGGEQEGAD
jgi:hypothetical protein